MKDQNAMAVELKGAARLVGQGRVMFERPLSVTPETLWEFIATKKGLAQWFMPTAHEVSAGGRFDFEDGWAGTVAEYVRPRRIVFTPDGAVNAFLRFDVHGGAGGCLFRLTDQLEATTDAARLLPEAPEHTAFQPGGPGIHWSGILAGYHGFADGLVDIVSGVAAAPFDYDAVCRAYAELLSAWHGKRP